MLTPPKLLIERKNTRKGLSIAEEVVDKEAKKQVRCSFVKFYRHKKLSVSHDKIC